MASMSHPSTPSLVSSNMTTTTSSNNINNNNINNSNTNINNNTSSSNNYIAPIQQNKPYTKIFWPNRCIDQKSGYLIGLNTRSFVVCVVDIVTDVPLNELEIILNKMTFDRRMLNCPLGYPPRILGEWIGKDKNTETPLPPKNLHELDIWISMEQTESGDPFLRKIYCNEYKIQTSSQIVMYDDTPPFYYTSIPIKFESMLSMASKGSKSNTNANSKITKTNNSVFSPTTSNNDKGNPPSPTSTKKHQVGSELESTFKQINCSYDIKTILHETIQKHFQFKLLRQQKLEELQKQEKQKQQQQHSNPQQLSPKDHKDSDTDTEPQSFFSKTLFTLRFRKNKKEIESESNKNKSSPTKSPITTSSSSTSSPSPSTSSSSNNNNNKKEETKSFKDTLLRPVYFFIWFVQMFSRLLEKILYIETPFLYSGCKLKDITTLGTHLDNRIFQVKQLSKQWDHLKKKTYWINNNDDRASYIEFHNSSWLIFNDILLGIGAGLLLNFFSGHVLYLIGKLNFFLNNDMLKTLILWLMGWPGGFKLNENLDKFFGRLILYYIDKWNLITTTISPHGELFLQIVCLSGIMGLSFLISVVIDLFYIFTLHISVFYSVSARFYLLQMVLLKSLWNLFRGVKFNPLRKRTDHCDFDVYQLLLGTLLFTLIFFLFPTTAIYYFFFAVFKSGVSIVMAIFALLLHFLNTFPLFNLVIFFIDKTYLPGGVIFDFKKKDMDNIKNNPNIILNDNEQQDQQQQQQSYDYNQQQEDSQQSPRQHIAATTTTTTTATTTTTIASIATTTNTGLSSPPIVQHVRNLSGTLISNSSGNAMITTSTNFHKRNLSQSSASPTPRISTQLEITYFTIRIKPTNLSTFFTPTIQLIQNTVSTYHPSKLSKCFFMGKPLNKIT